MRHREAHCNWWLGDSDYAAHSVLITPTCPITHTTYSAMWSSLPYERINLDGSTLPTLRSEVLLYDTNRSVVACYSDSAVGIYIAPNTHIYKPCTRVNDSNCILHLIEEPMKLYKGK